MKQGTGNNTSAGQKREPIAYAVSPSAVSELGAHHVRTTSLPLYIGRGLEAPMQGETSHPTGSQGKHK